MSFQEKVILFRKLRNEVRTDAKKPRQSVIEWRGRVATVINRTVLAYLSSKEHCSNDNL